VHRALPNALLRRFLTGLAMGGTAIGTCTAFFVANRRDND
jgi:hypothetical protein